LKRFSFDTLPISGLKLITRNGLADTRGIFARLYCEEEFESFDCNFKISQINHALTKKKGAVRGLHYQISPAAEIKLVSCIKGQVWDVAIDIRFGSSTFLQWHSEILSEKNGKALLIPEGFAHGYQAMTDDVELIYLHSEKYSPHLEKGLNINDPALSIKWPLSIGDISEKDAKNLFIADGYKGILL